MILLDSDHVSVLVDARHTLRSELMDRLDNSGDEICLPIAVVEEQLRGWLAAIHRMHDVHAQIVPYVRLAKLVNFLSEWPVIGWDDQAADIFTNMRRSRVRIGTQDLKIAAIALATRATLLSANPYDFQQVPGLKVEDWLHG